MGSATPADRNPSAPEVTLLLFALAREAAGLRTDRFVGETVEAVLSAACVRYGDRFAEILGHCRVWVNGEQVEPGDVLHAGDEVAVLPPVSGG